METLNKNNSLFPFPDSYIAQSRKRFNFIISKEFLACADSHLTRLFEKTTGLKINKLIEIGWAYEAIFSYEAGEISRFPVELWINNRNNPVFILWRSKSGRIYDAKDTDIDCADIEFWFEGLDPLLYHQQLYPKAKLPFKLKDLSFELVVTRLNMDCTVEMQLKKEELDNAKAILDQTDQFIDDFNTASVNRDRKDGVVHNWRRRIEENKLVYEIDTGFSGPVFIKKLLVFLSRLGVFEKVEVL